MAQPKKYIIPAKRSQKAIENDPDVLLRIGKTVMPSSFKSKPYLTGVEIQDKRNPNKFKVLVEGFLIADKDLSTTEGKSIAAQLPYMKIQVSNSAPNVVMRKSAGFTDAQADRVLEFLKQSSLFFEKSNPAQFDRITGEPIGKTASREWWFEDMRTAREFVMSDQDDTIEISIMLKAMRGKEKQLRDTLHLIGESPNANDNAEELFFQLRNATIADPKAESRRKFIKFVLRPEMSESQLGLLKLVNKAVDAGVVAYDQEYYTFRNSRLGTSTNEVVQHLEYDSDMAKDIRISLATTTGDDEDIDSANKVAESVNGKADQVKGIAYISDRMAKTGLYKKPSMALKGVDTIQEAVDVFNKKAKEEGLPTSEMLTEEFVLEEIGA